MRELSIAETTLETPIVPAEALKVSKITEIIHVGPESFLRLTVDDDVDDPSADPLVLSSIREEPVVLWRGRVWRVLDPSVMEFLEILATPAAA